MNSAKKIMKNQGLASEEKKQEEKEIVLKNKNKILIAIGVILIALCTAAVCYIQLRPREVLTVSGTNAQGSNITNKVYYTDAMYDIFATEQQYSNGLYEQIYGTSFWDQEDVDGNGTSGASMAKKSVMNALKQREILSMEAAKNNVTLDEADTKSVTDTVKSLTEQMTDKQKKMKGLSQAELQTALEKKALADKYKKKVIAELNIDEKAITSKIKKEDFRQYKLQYYSFDKKETKGTGKDAKEVNKSAADIKAGKADIAKLQKAALSAKDFTTGLITDSDKDQKDDKTGITYATKDLLETDKDFLDAKTLKVVKQMDNNKVSDVIETEDAFYVIKMINNNDPTAYENECKSKVNEEQEKKFEAKYTADIASQYTTEVSDYWKGRVKLGAVTTGAN